MRCARDPGQSARWRLTCDVAVADNRLEPTNDLPSQTVAGDFSASDEHDLYFWAGLVATVRLE